MIDILLKNSVIRLLLGLSALVALSGCQQKAPDPKTGQELYDYYCKACHAQNPSVGAYLEKLPKDKKRMASYQVLMMLQYQDQPPHPPISLTHLREDKANRLAEFVVRLPPR
jgi:mono/diheme cytochrome c family protein